MIAQYLIKLNSELLYFRIQNLQRNGIEYFALLWEKLTATNTFFYIYARKYITNSNVLASPKYTLPLSLHNVT